MTESWLSPGLGSGGSPCPSPCSFLPVPVRWRLPQGSHCLFPRSPSPSNPAAGEGKDASRPVPLPSLPTPPHLSPPFSPQLAMKGPPGPMGLTGRPGPLVSMAGVRASAGCPPHEDAPCRANLHIEQTFMVGSPCSPVFVGSTWTPRTERRCGGHGATGETHSAGLCEERVCRLMPQAGVWQAAGKPSPDTFPSSPSGSPGNAGTTGATREAGQTGKHWRFRFCLRQMSWSTVTCQSVPLSRPCPEGL